MAPTAGFDQELLDALATRREVLIETVRPDGTTRRTRIWIVVADGKVYVRSVRGDRGYWYQAAREQPDRVAIIVDGQLATVRAVPADDADSIARASNGLERKYGRSRSLDSMLVPQILHTTLRLEPRAESPSRA